MSQSLRSLIIALCLLVCPSLVMAQSVGLTDIHVQRGLVPLQLPYFEDKTNTASLPQAQVQFNRFATDAAASNIFNVRQPLQINTSGAMIWMLLNVKNNSTTTVWQFSFIDQTMSGLSAIKSVALYDLNNPDRPVASWSSKNTLLPPSLPLILPSQSVATRYILIETWPGLRADVIPVLKAEPIVAMEQKAQIQKTSFLWLVAGLVLGIGLIQLVLTRQLLQIGLIAHGVALSLILYVIQHPLLLTALPFYHGITPYLLIEGLFGFCAGLTALLACRSFGIRQPFLTLVVAVNFIIVAATLVLNTPQILSSILPLHIVPCVLLAVSALMIIAVTLLIIGKQSALLWFMPAWLSLLALAWVHDTHPVLGITLYAVLLTSACIIAVFSYWQSMTLETVSLQRRLKQELKYNKEKHDAETRDWQQKLDSERILQNELKAREQQRSAELDIARKEAEEANKAKSDFLAIISHEIRTPMNGIMGIVQLMHQTPLNEKQLEYVDVIKNSGETMVTLLNDILDYSKIEKGAIEIETVPFTLRNIVNSVVLLMSGRAKDKGLDVDIQIDQSVPDHLMGDSNRLRQILLNLVSNAIKFTERGHVTIKVEAMKSDKRQADLKFSVIDTGMGIAADVQEKLFKPYVQADASISRRFGGTGLGLNICRMLVEAMSGKIGLESEIGRGSTFWFELNFDVAPDDIAIKTISSEQYQPKRLLNILVIDDNSVNLKVVSGLLEMDGHAVTTTTQAEHGLKLISGTKIFDLVFVDLMMPGMDGKSFALKVRQNPNQTIARTPIYALTGLSGDIAKQAVHDAGLQGVVTKPVTQQNLRATIETVAAAVQTQEQDPDMAMKDIINKLAALAPKEREKLMHVIQEGTQGVKDVYHAIRQEIDYAMASDNLPPEEQVPQMAEEEAKSNVIPYLNYTMLDDLKRSLPEATIIELFNELIKKSHELIGALDEAAQLKDIEDVSEKAHNLKGMAGNFGLEALMQLSGRIENLARSSEAEKAYAHIPKVRPLFERTLSELEKWLA